VVKAGAGGAAAVVLGGPFAFTARAQTAPPSGAPSLRKGISLAGHGPLLVPDGDPNDYRLHGNREYFRSSGTAWAKLWVSWDQLQRDFVPRSRADSWAQLGGAPNGEAVLRRLDRQVRAANEDGVAVMLTLAATPAWASGAHLADRERGRKPLEATPAADLTPGGPWAWFLGYMCARYKPGVPASASGPLESLAGELAGAGNPDGAHVAAIEVCNEPNQVMWPQNGLAGRVAQMVRSAVAVSGGLGGPRILAPGTSDTDAVGKPDRSNWRAFTTDVLDALGDFRPGRRFGWSHHNYNDTDEERSAAGSRARVVLELLRASSLEGDGRLWLTESGVNIHPDQDQPPARAAQARKLERNFAEMAKLDGVHLWTQHVINDVAQNTFKSGLRDDFLSSPPRPGTPRPAYDAWARLPGAHTP